MSQGSVISINSQQPSEVKDLPQDLQNCLFVGLRTFKKCKHNNCKSFRLDPEKASSYAMANPNWRKM